MALNHQINTILFETFIYVIFAIFYYYPLLWNNIHSIVTIHLYFIFWSTFMLPCCTSRMIHQVNFLVLHNWFELSFPLLRLVCMAGLKNPVCPIIYPLLEGEYLDSFPSHKYKCYVKWTHPGFELMWTSQFHTITIIPQVPGIYCCKGEQLRHELNNIFKGK